MKKTEAEDLLDAYVKGRADWDTFFHWLYFSFGFVVGAAALIILKH